MDNYIVLDGDRVVGASTRLQGAELIRADEARLVANESIGGRLPGLADPAHVSASWRQVYGATYDRMTVTNTELQDHDG